MSEERDSFEEALFVVNPIEPSVIAKGILGVGGPCSNEKVEYAKRILSPEGFRKWLKSEEANGTVPKHDVEFTEVTGVLHDDEPERMALALDGAVQRRKLAAENAKKVATTPVARAAWAERAEEKNEEVLRTARAILENRIAPMSMNALAVEVARKMDELRQADSTSDDKRWTAKGVAHRLERVRHRLPKGKITSPKNRSRD